MRSSVRNWWRLPFWLLSPLTGAKSFVGNPLIGSTRLNRLGLHAARIRLAHAVARWRRRRLAPHLPASLQKDFDRNGFIVVSDVLDPVEFSQMRDCLLALDVQSRSHQQGDTITSRVAVAPSLLAAVPQLGTLLSSPSIQAILSYVASFKSRPLYYLQAISSGIADGPPDPQLDLHSDTFHPSMKAWLFLNDVKEEDAPLTYVAGSHKLTPARLAWERVKSINVLATGDRLSQRGSFRISGEELADLGLPEPTRFVVPANTLVVIDTCGFHARGRSQRPCLRTEVWAYCRRSPYLPWAGLDPFSVRLLADRRGEWLATALDWLDRKGWAKQHWKVDGVWRDVAKSPVVRVAEP
jgi:hypothetical protein